MLIYVIFRNLISCKVYEEKEHSENRYYIEIVQHVAGNTSSMLVNPDPVKKPRVRCRTVELARTVAQQINYAKRLYTEYLYTLNTDNVSTEDWMNSKHIFLFNSRKEPVFNQKSQSAVFKSQMRQIISFSHLSLESERMWYNGGICKCNQLPNDLVLSW